MSHFGNLILWIYIILLVAGGMTGYLKAGSKPSLITAASFAAALSLCAAGIIQQAKYIADVLLIALLIFFAIRLSKGGKFMPSGLMLSMTVLVLALINIRFS
jgi:uncharacterized membrane protein (UPF0136 family)